MHMQVTQNIKYLMYKIYFNSIDIRGLHEILKLLIYREVHEYKVRPYREWSSIEPPIRPPNTRRLLLPCLVRNLGHAYRYHHNEFIGLFYVNYVNYSIILWLFPQPQSFIIEGECYNSIPIPITPVGQWFMTS